MRFLSHDPCIAGHCRLGSSPYLKHGLLILFLAWSSVLVSCMPKPLIQPLKPATLGQSIEARQQVDVRYRGQRHSMQFALRVSPDDLTLIGLSTIGQRLFTLGWNGHRITRDDALDQHQALPARHILADLQLAYWPLPSLRLALADTGMRLQQIDDTRMLWDGEQLLWFAHHGPGQVWKQHLTIYNAQLDYRLDVQPLDFNGQ